jgi:hypothetical protein
LPDSVRLDPLIVPAVMFPEESMTSTGVEPTDPTENPPSERNDLIAIWMKFYVLFIMP